MPASQGYTDNVVDLKYFVNSSDRTGPMNRSSFKVVLLKWITPRFLRERIVSLCGIKCLKTMKMGKPLESVRAFNSKERTQIEISHPIIRRGNVGLIDDIQGEVQAGGPDDIARIAQEARRAAAVSL